MCKIIVMTNASKIENFDDFSRQAASWLDQNDGYGHAIQGENGVFGVRTLNPKTYSKIKDVPQFIDYTESKFGVESKIKGAAMLHGRISTNSVNLTNTHPIERDAWHLIHNGVVTHHGEKYVQNTSNDSEHVLYNLIKGIDSVASNLTGYYALGAFDPNGRLHVIRDSIAPLFYAYSSKLESDIFATTEDLIESIGDYIDEELTALKMKNDTHLIYENNKLVHHGTFKSRGYDSHSKSLTHKSLGFTSFDMYDQYNDYDQEEELLQSIDDSWLEEVDHYLDDSYVIEYKNIEIDSQDFKMLRLNEQIECVIKRIDGTFLSPFKVKQIGKRKKQA